MVSCIPGRRFNLWATREVSKESACNLRDLGSILGLGRSPGGGHGNPLQYSCLEKPHGQKSLAGYSPWGHKESDMTERPSTAQHSTLLFCFLQTPTLSSPDGLVPQSTTQGMQGDYLIDVCPPQFCKLSGHQSPACTLDVYFWMNEQIAFLTPILII